MLKSMGAMTRTLHDLMADHADTSLFAILVRLVIKGGQKYGHTGFLW